MKTVIKSSPKTSIGDIAKAAGVSKATVSYVLRNRPGPSLKMRARVLEVAKERGYIPDARMGSWMARIRDSTSKALIPIAWLDTNWDEGAWKYKFLSPYLEGAQAKAAELGYRLESIWAGEPGMTMQRISRIVYHRGIEGVVVTHQTRHFRLNWNKVAAVTIEATLQSPRLHRATTDHTFNLLLALKMLKRMGYRRIGIFLERGVGRDSYNLCKAGAYHFQAGIPPAQVVPPLFYVSREKDTNRGEIQREFAAWVRAHRPDVIVGHDNRLVAMVQALGLRVPEEMGVAHIATDDDVADWAGINSNRREVGAAAIGWLVYLLQNRQFGVPQAAMNIGIRGTWHGGRTLLAPKPK